MILDLSALPHHCRDEALHLVSNVCRKHMAMISEALPGYPPGQKRDDLDAHARACAELVAEIHRERNAPAPSSN